MRFLNLARLETAAKLLRADPKHSVIDVAFGCGFRASQYFSYQFSRHFGMTPRRTGKGTHHGVRAAGGNHAGSEESAPPFFGL
jgi:transcriptional regulator GlxA family with amidase domain